MRLLITLMLPLLAAAEPKVTWTKAFKGATPGWYQVEVARDGSAVYKEAPDDAQPITFKLPEQRVNELFGKIDALERFAKPLESNLKVANMGTKTGVFEDGKLRHQVVFNYSLDPNAQAIAALFDAISETQQHFIALERALKFDRLGVNKILLQIETSWDKQRLIGYDPLLPLLEKVVRNESIMNMTRERASRLVAMLTTPPAQKTAENQQ